MSEVSEQGAVCSHCSTLRHKVALLCDVLEEIREEAQSNYFDCDDLTRLARIRSLAEQAIEQYREE